MSQLPQTLDWQLGGSRPFSRLAGLVVCCVTLGYLLAAHSFSQKLFFILALAITMAFISVRHPWLGVVSPLVIFIVLGIGIPSGFSALGASINMADMLLLPALGPTAVKVIAGRRDLDLPSVPAIMLAAWMLIATAVGLYYGNSFSLVRNELHVLLFIPLAYYWAVVELRSARDLRLVTIVILAATAFAGFKAGYISYFVGHAQEGYSDAWQASTAISEQLGGQRTILNGADTFFVLAMPFIAAIALFYRKRRTVMLLTGAFILTFFGLLISLTRTNWATVAVAILLVMALGARAAGSRVVQMAAAIGLLSIMAIFLSSYMTFGTSTYDLGELLQRRLEPNPYTGAGNLNYRIRESEALIEQAQRHSTLGNGLGARYAFVEFRGSPTVSWAHNGHLWMYLKSGFFGIFLFYSAMVIVVWQMIGISFRSASRLFRATSLGFGVAMISLMIMSLLVNRISSMEGAYFIGLAVAWPQIIARIEADDSPINDQGVPDE